MTAPTGDPIVVGSVAVEIQATARGFARSLRREIKNAFKDLDLGKTLSEELAKAKVRVPRVKVPLAPDTEGLGDSLPETIPTKRPPKVPTELDPLIREFQAQMRREAAKLARQVTVDIPVTPETARLRTRLAAEIAEIEKRTRVEVSTDPGERRDYEQKLRALVDAVGRDIKVKIPIDPDPEPLRRARIPPVKVPVQIDRNQLTRALRAVSGVVAKGLSGLTSASAGLVGVILKVLGAVTALSAGLAGVAALVGAVSAALAGLASAAAGAIPVIAALVESLATAAGVLIAIPGAIAVVVTAVSVLKIGLTGLKDAFKALASGDAEKLNEALKQLAPNAAAFVKQVQKLQPAIKKLRLNVQNRLFANAAKTLAGLAGTILPLVHRRFGEIADVVNRAVVDALTRLNTVANRAGLDTLFASTAATARNLGAALRPAVQALLDVVVVGARIAAQFSGSTAAAIADFAKRISEMAASGALRKIFDDGLATVGQFLDLTKNVLGTIKGILAAAGGTQGGGIFAFFKTLNEVVNRGDVQAALKGFFDSLADLGVALTPVLVALLHALVPVASAIATVATAFAGPLITLATALGSAIASLAPAFVALAPTVTALAGALGPLATILADLVTAAAPGITALLAGLTSGLAALAPAAKPVGAALGAIFAALGPLLGVLGQELAALLTALVPAFTALIPAATQVGLALGPLVTILADLLTGIAPAIAPVLGALAATLAALVPAAKPVADALVAIVTAVTPLLPALGQELALALIGVAGALSAVAAELGPVFKLFGQTAASALSVFVPLLLDLVENVLPTAVAFGSALFQALAPLAPVILEIARAVADQLLQFLPELVALGQQLVPVFFEIANQVGVALLDIFKQLAPVIPELVAAGLELAVALAELFVQIAPLIPPMLQFSLLVLKLISGPTGLMILTGLITLFTGHVKMMTAIIGGVIGAFRNVIAAVSQFGSAIVSGVGKAMGVIRGIPAAITNALGNLGSLLYNAGRNVVEGLWDGIKSMTGWLKDTLIGWAKSAIPGPIAKALGISSPSKLIAEQIGEPITLGVVEGMLAQNRALAAASQELADQVAADLARVLPGTVAFDPFASDTADWPALAGEDTAVLNRLDALLAAVVAGQVIEADGVAIARTVRRGERDLARR